MNVLYEEEGSFKVGAVLSDNTTSLQVEAPHGKRSKVKATAVVLRFEQPGVAEFMERAQALAAGLDPDFLWECCGQDEFGFDALARDYFGHAPDALEAAGLLIRLHGSPMHFYKKGKGRYKPAPPEALKAALASVEKKRRQAEQQANYVERLTRCELPEEFQPLLPDLLYAPDKNAVEWKALEAACAATRLGVPQLLEKCGALPSPHDYHLNRFLLEHFPDGAEFGDFAPVRAPEGLPVSEVAAFSIDDAATTEIDDAFSVATLANGNLRIGIHIAAPVLGIAPGSPLDRVAARRLSTVYMPGAKITMLPDAVIHLFTLGEERVCPALSMYLDVNPGDWRVVATDSRIERLRIAANLRHDSLEEHFNEITVAEGHVDYPFGDELRVLWQFANGLEQGRGRAEAGAPERVDYTFRVDGDQITISERKRGSPIDKVVSELMIQVNTEWGRQLSDAGIAAIYRSQGNGKVKMTTVPSPHQGLGVEQYIWASSPLRRYVDLVNQRQLIALIRGEAPPYGPKDEALLTAMRDFELAYDAYGEFQRTMERYWCLRWLTQEGISSIGGSVLRENLVKVDRLPLVARVPSLPDLAPGTRVALGLAGLDMLDLTVGFRFQHRLEA
ncbi:MAG: RNB domain-containing ribonuclease [Betaproteobacteria bacterium]|nr:RNB domain-containing ribonuclease [Betaproteobacteria bacterium]